MRRARPDGYVSGVREDSPGSGEDPARADRPTGDDRREPEDERQPGGTGSIDRGAVIAAGLRSSASWSARLLLIGLAVAASLWLLGQIWVAVLPIALALLLSSVLWPLVSWAEDRRLPAGLAAAVSVVGLLIVVVIVLVLVVRPAVDQAVALSSSVSAGIEQLRSWLASSPLGIGSDWVDRATSEVTGWVRSSAQQIASGVFSGVTAITSGLVTFVLVVVLSFLFLKDGSRFLPWIRRQSGPVVGVHATELLARIWLTLGRFIQVQALVSLVDAVLIGIGLLILQVPLAPALAVLTFFAGFVPIVGAVVAGTLAVLVALVSNGWTTALLVVALVIVVQQVEANVTQPFLQGHSLHLHAAVVILSVTAGGSMFGIAGAFLAVPVVAVAATLLRYLSEQTALRAGEVDPSDVHTLTTQGDRAVRAGERAARWLRARRRPRSS